jgi:hypothetical protein
MARASHPDVPPSNEWANIRRGDEKARAHLVHRVSRAHIGYSCRAMVGCGGPTRRTDGELGMLERGVCLRRPQWSSQGQLGCRSVHSTRAWPLTGAR